VYDASRPAVLEEKLMGVGVAWDKDVRVQDSGGAFHMKGYLTQSNFSYNKSS
jgi:hypothetical protein